MYKKDVKPINTTEKALEVLIESQSTYWIKWNHQYSEELSKEFEDSGFGTLSEIYLDYYGFSSFKSFQKKITDLLKQLVFEFKKRKSIGELTADYFLVIIDELQQAESSYELIYARETEFHYQKDAQIVWSELPGDREEKTLDSIEESLFNEIYLISEFKYTETIKLINSLSELIVPNQGTASINLELKLSVPEIALLFRLLDEENLIEYKHKTEIYRHIANTLKTTKQENISEASVKNKFLSPDNTAINKLKILLANLKIQLQKIENK